MKLKVCLVCLLSIFVAGNAMAEADAGLRYITSRGRINCGTEAGNRIFANKDADGNWYGIDVEMCKMLSTAIFGRSDRITMVPLLSNQVAKALQTNKIDIMIGGLPYSATNEITSQAHPAALFYYDKQGFLARTLKDAQSMEAYKGSRVCVTNQTDDMAKLSTYNDRHQLEFQVLPFPTLQKAREAFLLKRCQLMSANYLLLKDILDNSPAGTSDVELLPETIADRQIYLYVDRHNVTLKSIAKWVLNAAKLAEEYEINSENIDMAVLSQDYVVKNLLGVDPALWNMFKLEPNWVPTFIKESGNYGEIFEKNLGGESKYKVPREKSNLIKNGGEIIPEMFL